MAKDKVGKVMHEFRTGALHSGSKKGPVVKNRKQAIAIAMSEAGMKKKYATGGMMKDSDEAQDKAMIKSAIAQHDKQMHGGKKESIKLAKGGHVDAKHAMCSYDTGGPVHMMTKVKGGLSHKKMDGVSHFAHGGSVSGRADGCVSKGHTKGKMY